MEIGDKNIHQSNFFKFQISEAISEFRSPGADHRVALSAANIWGRSQGGIISGQHQGQVTRWHYQWLAYEADHRRYFGRPASEADHREHFQRP